MACRARNSVASVWSRLGAVLPWRRVGGHVCWVSGPGDVCQGVSAVAAGPSSLVTLGLCDLILAVTTVSRRPAKVERPSGTHEEATDARRAVHGGVRGLALERCTGWGFGPLRGEGGSHEAREGTLTTLCACCAGGCLPPGS